MLKKTTVLGVEKIHFLVFGTEMSEVMRSFLKNISWSLFGGIIASAVLFAVNILAGRLLGVEEYGKYNIVLAIAQILMIFFLFGMDTGSARSIPGEKTDKNKAKNISSAFYFAIFVTVIFSLVYMVSYKYIKLFFKFDNYSILLAALLLGILLAYRQLFDSFIRGLHLFKTQSLFKIIESIFVIGAFLLAVKIFKLASYWSYIQAITTGGLILIIGYLIFLRKYLSSFDPTVLKENLSYSKLAFIASLLGVVFGSLDKIAVGKYLNFHELGIYSAYYTASFVLVSQAIVLFDNVFFPTISKYRNNLNEVVKKLDKITIIFSIPFFIAMAGVIFVILKLFGSSYGIDWMLISAFSVLAVTKVAFSINVSVVNVYSEASLKKAIFYGNSINILFLLAFFFFLHLFGMSLSLIVLLLIFYHIALFIANKIIMVQYGFYKSN